MTVQPTESGTIEPPVRRLEEVLRDLHVLEKELVHHLTYTRWQRGAKPSRAADNIGDAIIFVRNARRTCGSLA